MAFCLALLVFLLLTGCSGSEEKTEEFRIGLIAPITNLVRFNAHHMAAARVAELNAQGGLDVGGRKVMVRLIVEDSGGKIEQTMSAMTRLIQQERVSAIVGPYFSREAIPVAAAMEILRVPMLTPSATNPEVTRGRKFAFRVCQMDSDQGAALAEYAYRDLGLRRAAVLYDEADAYSAGLADYFREAFAAQPGAVVLMEPYPTGAQDFLPQLAHIRDSGAQVLMLPNFPAELSVQIQQARAAGFEGKLLGGDSWDSDYGFHSLPEAQGALFSTDFAAAAADPKLLAAAQALARKTGVPLDKNSALTLDAMELLFTAARKAGSLDPVSLRSSLASVTGFDGLTGPIAYNGSGDPLPSACLVEINGGAMTLRARLNAPRQ